MMLVRTVNVFKSDVRSVPLSRVQIYAVDRDTDSLLICFDQNDATLKFNQSF